MSSSHVSISLVKTKKADLNSTANGITDICIILDDLRFTINQNFVSAVLDTITQISEGIMQTFTAAPLAKLEPAYSTDADSNIRITALLKSLEIWIPADSTDINTQAMHINLALTAVYTLCRKERAFYSINNTVIHSICLTKADEFDLTLSHFGAELASSLENMRIFKKMILPGRLSLEMKIKKEKDDDSLSCFSTLRIECFCIIIGFRDIDFFRNLLNNFSKLKIKSSSKNNAVEKSSPKEQPHFEVGIDSDSFQITIVDDTSNDLQSLFYIQFCNISFHLSSIPEKSGIVGEIIMFVKNYNARLGA